ncbi:MAG: transporter substrate-binding domain-containing protein [Anaerovibrio sp.]|uniref:ATP-binding protein n=1 Tax=Anaerovibrio sp. TaxID=1872532 RepID=UPI0025D50FCD|nr:transporter substrate-binding domain-containing protein [Anaerovibrio sp.]MCR5175775.1 transporter substrate-binding domain-containing protein [Anaerovibrio sp.]
MQHQGYPEKKVSFYLITCLLLVTVQLFACCLMPVHAGQGDYWQQRKTVRVAAYDADEIFVLRDAHNKRNGYAYEYIETIARYAGWDIEYVEYPGFLACIDAVKNGQADLAYDVSYTPERARYLAFPNEPMGRESYYLYFLDHNKNIISGDLGTLQNKKIGVSRGTTQIKLLQKWLDKNNVNAEIVEYANSSERRAALWNNEVQLNLIANRYNKEHFIAFGNIGEDDFFLVVNQARPDLLNDLNDAHRLVVSINPYFMTDISKQHFAYSSIRKSLSTSEIQWLDKHPTIRVGCLKDDPPFSYMTPDSPDIKGALIDTLTHLFDTLYIDKSRLSFKIYESYDDMVTALHNDEIDMLGEYFFDYDLANRDNVIISTKIYDAQIGIIRQTGTSYNDAFNTLVYPNSRGQKGYSYAKYSGSTFIPCDNLMACLDEVHKGNATGAIGFGPTIAIYAQVYPDLEYAPIMETVPLCFATSKNNVPLISMLDKGRGLMNTGEIDAIISGHLPVVPFSVHRFISTHLISCILGLAVIIFIIFLFFFMSVTNRRLASQNNLIDKQNAALKKYHVQLNQSLEDVKKADKAKTSFLFNMSHDIRTPMNAIIGFTNLLEKNIENKELCLNYIDKIQSSNKFLLSRINNVLEMARIESGKATLEESYINVEQMITEVGAVFEPQMEEKGITFSYSLSAEHKYILLDATKAREILLNIISNALKYTPSGGSVEFNVIEEPSPKPDIARFKITVTDTGIGMPKEFLENIFDAFSRERNTTQSGIIGTGLGMHIVKKLVDLMGGEITISSEMGKGTSITILISSKIGQEPPCSDPDDEPGKTDVTQFQGMRILLAEDNDFNAEIAKTLLEEEGFIVEHARDGLECVDMLTNSQPGYYDFILMDVQMPNMDGYSATITIRGLKEPLHANIPIIAMTANAFDEDKHNSLMAGMNSHIPKPFEIDQLFNIIDDVMKHREYYIRSHEMVGFKEKHAAAGIKCGYFIFELSKKADIIYTDETFLNIFGCDSYDEFMDYTKGSAANILPEQKLNSLLHNLAEVGKANSCIEAFEFNGVRTDGQPLRLDAIGCPAYTGNEIVAFVYVAEISNTIVM